MLKRNSASYLIPLLTQLKICHEAFLFRISNEKADLDHLKGFLRAFSPNRVLKNTVGLTLKVLIRQQFFNSVLNQSEKLKKNIEIRTLRVVQLSLNFNHKNVLNHVDSKCFKFYVLTAYDRSVHSKAAFFRDKNDDKTSHYIFYFNFKMSFCSSTM